jgi:DNA-binding Lrp family transcriptional regulator
MEQLDQLDLNILRELQKNSRITYRALGKKVNSSGNTVKTRVDKMLQAGVIRNFISLVDPRLFQYNIAFLLIPGFDINDKSEAGTTFTNIISLAGEPYYQISCMGQVSVCNILIKGDNEAVQRKIDLLKKSLPKSSRVLGVYKANDVNQATHEELSLNDTDSELMYHLVQDPRSKVDELAQKLGITSKSIKRKSNKLTANRVMQFSIVYRPNAIQGYIPFHILIDLHDSEQQALKLLDNIRERFGENFFFEPIVNSSIIILNLYSTTIYRLDEIYRKIKDLYKLKRAELFIPNNVVISQRWLLDELKSRLDRRIAHQIAE